MNVPQRVVNGPHTESNLPHHSAEANTEGTTMSQQGPSPHAAGSRQPPRWPWWVFRGCISVAGVLVFNQAVFAGQFLAGSYGSLNTHMMNAFLINGVLLVSTVAAVLLRWPGRGPLWPAAACLGLTVLVGVQIAAGFGRVLALHVPLGVSIIGLTILLAGWAWRRHPVRPPGTDLTEPDLAEPSAVVPATTDEPNGPRR